MSMRRLRYTGSRRQSFTENEVGEVEAGGEFEVPEDQAERYLRRGDIEDTVPPGGDDDKGSDPPDPEGADDSDDASASQDGDTNGASPSGDGDLSGSPTGNGGTGEQ